MKKTISLYFLILGVFHLGISQESKYEVVNMEAANSNYADFGLSFFGDKVVFASSNIENTKAKKWKENAQPFLDLFTANIDDEGKLLDKEPLGKGINSTVHESNAVFTKDGNTIYFTRNNCKGLKCNKDGEGYYNIQLFTATKREDGEWGKIIRMPFNSDEYQTGHPALSQDEKTLYFTSDMPGGIGKTDIYKVSISENGYGDPVNLGSSINSEASEMFPFMSKEGRFYFSSDRAYGKGGLDIYSTNASLENVKALDTPINGDKDDFAYVIHPETDIAYFSSNRSGGSGDDDIYMVKRLIEEQEEETIVVEEEKPCGPKTDGEVREKFSRKLVPGAVVQLFDMSTNEKVDEIIVNDTGRFEFQLECNKKYRVVGVKKFYKEGAVLFETKDIDVDVPLVLEIEEELRITNGKQIIRINPIYFDYDKSYLRDDAKVQLDKVVAIMNKYPDINVEGGSHTDSRGRDQYNRQLSSRRASATLDYILSRGISPTRITVKGYGESELVNHCSNGTTCSDLQHQMNRRTEFVVLTN